MQIQRFAILAESGCPIEQPCREPRNRAINRFGVLVRPATKSKEALLLNRCDLTVCRRSDV